MAYKLPVFQIIIIPLLQNELLQYRVKIQTYCIS
jgi:hypothetical protein